MAVKKNNSAAGFTKEQILAADRYKHNRDLINALLNNDRDYSLSEVDAMIEKYMKGKVK